MMKYIYAGMWAVNLSVIFICPWIVKAYNLSPETGALAAKILIYHAVCCLITWPLAFSLPNTLRAAGDVKFTLIVSLVSMWVFRIGFSFFLGQTLQWGVFGTWVAMTIDWLFRAVMFIYRYRSGKWQEIRF